MTSIKPVKHGAVSLWYNCSNK